MLPLTGFMLTGILDEAEMSFLGIGVNGSWTLLGVIVAAVFTDIGTTYNSEVDVCRL